MFYLAAFESFFAIRDIASNMYTECCLVLLFKTTPTSCAMEQDKFTCRAGFLKSAETEGDMVTYRASEKS